MMDSFRPVNFTAGKKWALITAQPKCPRRRNESPGKKERCGGLWARRRRSGRLAWQRVGQTMGKSRTGEGEKTSCTKNREMLRIPRPNSFQASYLGADLVAALPGLDVDDLAHLEAEVLLVVVGKSSLERRCSLRGPRDRTGLTEGRRGRAEGQARA